MYGKYECFVMQMLYVGVHHVAVLNAAFCMTCISLMLVEDARGQFFLCRYGCMYFLAALVLVCVDVMVMSTA